MSCNNKGFVAQIKQSGCQPLAEVLTFGDEYIQPAAFGQKISYDQLVGIQRSPDQAGRFNRMAG